MFDAFSFAERAELVDRPTSTGVSVTKQDERQLAKCRGRNVDAELVIGISSHLFDELAHVLRIQTHRTVGMNGQADRAKVISFLPI